MRGAPVPSPSARLVRDMRADESDLITSYFLSLRAAEIARLGIDPAKLPDADAWNRRLREDFAQPISVRRWHFVIWEVGGTPVGHSNIGDIERGKQGYMHLHMWRSDLRGQGHGRAFVLESAMRYFAVIDLQVVYCQPNAFNVAPNRALARAGFEYLETYETTPGWLNHHQPVTRWALTRERLNTIAGRHVASPTSAVLDSSR
jgi:RimJ/RimL family protein N-acetyltransferase